VSREDEIRKLEEQIKAIRENIIEVETEFEAQPNIKKQILSNLRAQEKILLELLREKKGETT
jgi:hypothetical protein